ncbi:MAG: hypothetical protein JWR14_2613 [Caballeronia sp.]|jgi:hypothetical protein|nr:hypothetical protein [Caballeronia sp.]
MNKYKAGARENRYAFFGFGEERLRQTADGR